MSKYVVICRFIFIVIFMKYINKTLINYDIWLQVTRKDYIQFSKKYINLIISILYNCIAFIVIGIKWAEVLVMINNLLTILNSSFNFLIYLSFCGKQKKRRAKYTSTYLTTTTTVQTSAISRENDSSRKTIRKFQLISQVQSNFGFHSFG